MKKRIILFLSILLFTLPVAAQKLNSPIVDEQVVFEENDGILAVEAEYFYKQSKNDVRQWYRTSKNEWPNVGRDEDGPHCADAGNNCYLEILPDTRVTHSDKLIHGENFSNTAGIMAILHYKIKINNPGRYYVWVRAHSTGGEDNGVHVGMDGTWPETGNRLQWCDGKNTWKWESKQRTEEVHCGEPYLIYLDITKPGMHEITFSMREDGFEFDRFLLTNKKDYIPTGVGPDVSALGKLPKPYPVVTANPAGKTSFLYSVENSVKGIKLIRAKTLNIEETGFYTDKDWLAIDPDKNKKATVKTPYNGKNGAYDVLILGVGENDGNSKYTIEINNNSVGEFQVPPSQFSFEEGTKFMGVFPNIQLKTGDLISITSEVGSNDGQEFSRGRWGGLVIVPLGQGTTVLDELKNVRTQANVGNITSEKILESVIPEITGELKKWHKVTLTFDGPKVSENDDYNPFMNYRFNVEFTHKATRKSYTVPGYFAADGNAGETSETTGNKWRVHFAPDETGVWNYKVDFRKGKWVAVSNKKNSGTTGKHMDLSEGVFTVEASDKTGKDLRAKGRLKYDGTRYLKFSETEKPMLKVGPDAPENFLAYAHFDGTFNNDGHKDNLVKTWEAHRTDWKEGDPSWQNGKGKAIIGAINYLESKGLNVFSFLTMNIAGDDRNVFPYVDYDTYDRFDCSKLDQWEIIFEHADALGMFLHFKLMEAENQGLLDNGAIGANTKLYYREIMARFGHHLALNWNVGEELGEWRDNNQTPPLQTVQRLAAANYFFQNDPYHHHIVIHNGVPFNDILGPESKYTGISLQTHRPDFGKVHGQVLHWLGASSNAGKQWAVAVDEPGDAQHALVTDAEDPTHDNARINGLWGAFMAGAWGTEWYFGYKHPHSDLTCQDYRSRDLFWDQCKHLVDFFENNNVDVTKTQNHDSLVAEGDYCLAAPGEFYIVFLKNGKGTLNLESEEGKFEIKWYDPRNGGELQKGKIKSAKGKQIIELNNPPNEAKKDWVVFLSKI